MLEVLGDGPGAHLELVGDGDVGAAHGDEPHDLDLAVGETGKPAASQGAEDLAGLLAPASALQRGDQRGPERAEQGAIGVAEVAAGTAQCDADHLLIGARQADGHLVLDWYAAEELGVQAQPVESLPAEKVADHDRFTAAGGTVVVDQRVLVHVCGEYRLGRRVERTGWVVCVTRFSRG